MLIYLFVALGGALGSMARYGMGVSFSTLTGLASPWGTILINILGSRSDFLRPPPGLAGG
jgi:CrcB protein